MTSAGARHLASAPESEINFSLRHFVLGEIKGRVARWRGTLALDTRGPRHFRIDVVVDAASLETGDPERDDHIRSPEFLDARSFPEIRFRSSDVGPEPDGRTFTVTGDLAIRDVARPVTFTMSEQDASAAESAVRTRVFVGHAVVDRQEYGLHWNQDLDRGGLVVGDKVDVAFRVVLRDTGAVRSVSEPQTETDRPDPWGQEVPGMTPLR